MRKVAPIEFSFVYADKLNSAERLEDAYARIFRTAWKNVLAKQSTLEYSDKKHEKTNRSVRVSYPGGSGQDSQSKDDNCVSDGQKRPDSCGQVWTGVEDKRKASQSAVRG